MIYYYVFHCNDHHWYDKKDIYRNWKYIYVRASISLMMKIILILYKKYFNHNSLITISWVSIRIFQCAIVDSGRNVGLNARCNVLPRIKNCTLNNSDRNSANSYSRLELHNWHSQYHENNETENGFVFNEYYIFIMCISGIHLLILISKTCSKLNLL